MPDEQSLYVFMSPEIERLLLDHETSIVELVRRAGLDAKVETAVNPAEAVKGEKEVATVLLGSAALIAAATPLLRQLIRTIAGRDATFVERRLVPVQDLEGNLVLGPHRKPILHWVDVPKTPSEPAPLDVMVKGFGIEISFGGRS